MNFKHPLILASSSPRRKYLMHEIGFQFTVQSPNIDESFPSDMAPEKVPEWLAERKARIIPIHDEVVVASDTVVILAGRILNKPLNRDEAIQMLSDLSGKTHNVITAVCLHSKQRTEVFADATLVTFKRLTQQQKEFYIDHYNPLDKAGSYGAQDCLPPRMNPCSKEEIEFLDRINKSELITKSIQSDDDKNRIVIIESLAGAYFTVMGLPIHLVYDKLMSHFND